MHELTLAPTPRGDKSGILRGGGGKGDERQVDGKEDDGKMTTVCRSLTPVGEKKG